jgi:hypothetical protein
MFFTSFLFFPVLAIAAVEPPNRNVLVKQPSVRSPDYLGNVKLSMDAVKSQATDSGYFCSVEQIISDTCLFRVDGVCDADGVLCKEQSDCFDCDPCRLSYLSCGSCVTDPACLWCQTFDPFEQAYYGLCSSVEIAQVFPNACGFDASEAYGSVCPDIVTNSTGTCDISVDSCPFQFDSECDTVGDSALCSAGTDCFDCDPCLNIVTQAIESNILEITAICNLCIDAGCSYCIAPTPDGTFIAVCSSPDIASFLPNFCSNVGGSSYQTTCDGTDVTPPPVPINTNFSDSCNYANDSCLYALDGECDSGIDFFSFCGPNSDCIDCDPCQQKRFDGCDACVAVGCYWCSLDSLCLSGNPMITGGNGNSSDPFQKQFSCISAEDFTQTCPASNKDNSVYDDPLYDAESWVYDLIGVQDVWKSGISKF